MIMPIRITAIAMLVALVSSSAAFAQAERSQRLFRGLFGGPAPNPDRRTQLDLDVSLFGAYDTDIPASHGAVPLPNRQYAGGYSGVDAGLTFTHRRQHVHFAVTGGSSVQDFPTLHSLTTVGNQAAASIGADLGRRVTLDLVGSALYSPLFMLAPFSTTPATSAADVVPPPVNTAIQRDTMLNYSTGLNGQIALGPRWSLSSNAALTMSDVRYASGSVTQQVWSAGVTMHRQMTAASGLHLGYMQQDMIALRRSPAFRVYNANLGMDYHKALGRTHKTTMSASFGTGMAQDGLIHLYTVIGDASINREIGRSWVARAAYHRGFGLVPGFNRPMFSDSADGSVGGLITRRVDFIFDAAYTNGHIGITGVTNTLSGYNGTARVRYALTQLYGVYGEYVLYWYDLSNNVYVATSLPPTVLRQGVRVGLSVNLPLVR